jgi:hypothetical protein
MKHKILCATLTASLLIVATAALALAWPDQPPDKVLISGPEIEGQLEIKSEEARGLFRLGYLEDLEAGSPVPPQLNAGYQIVRYFGGGGFEFARLTYYPNPNGGRGYLFWEDGPMLQGGHTPYHATWLYARPEAEVKLRALLKNLSTETAKEVPGSGNASDSRNVGSVAGDTAGTGYIVKPTEASAANTAAGKLRLLSATGIAPIGAVVAVLAGAGVFVALRGRREAGAR